MYMCEFFKLLLAAYIDNWASTVSPTAMLLTTCISSALLYFTQNFITRLLLQTVNFPSV